MPRRSEAEHQQRRDACASQPARVHVERKGEAADTREERNPEHRRGTVRPANDADEQDASKSGAGKVRGVQTAHAAREAGQHKANHNAAHHKRQRNHEVREGDRIECDDVEPHAEGNAQLGHEAEHHAGREDDSRKREPLAQAIGGEHTWREVDEQGAGRHAEHRDRQRDEREVIQHRHAEDPREEDLVHQRRHGDKENPDVRWWTRLADREAGVWIQTHHHTM